MYHIANDKRAKRSADLIFDGLVDCLQEKTFENISVSDIYQRTKVSRATFYRLFDSIPDVIQYQADVFFEEQIGHQENSSDFILTYIEELVQQNNLMKAILSSHRFDILYQAHNNYYTRERTAQQLEHPDLTQRQQDYLVATMGAILPSYIKIWFENGQQESPKELVQVIKTSLQQLNKLL